MIAFRPFGRGRTGLAPGRTAETLALLILATAAVAYSTMQTMVLPAIPALGRELDAGPEAIVWVVSAFFISSAVSIPVVGRLGDAYGRVRVLTVAMGLFALGTVAAAAAPGLEALIAARLLQGVGAAVFPLSYAIADELLPPDRRTAGMGAISAAFGFGSSVGYVLGGPLMDAFGWRGIFLAALIPALVAIVSLPLLPRSRGTSAVRMDWAGAGLLSVVLGALLLVIGQGSRWGWDAPVTLALVAAVVGGLAAWTWVERRHASPMVDLRVFLGRRMLLINVSAVFVGYAFFAIFVLVPGFVTADPDRQGYGFATSDQHVGLFFMPYAVAMVVGGTIAGRAGARRQTGVLRFGIVLVVGGLLVLAVAPVSAWVVATAIGAIGIGCGACLTALAQLVMSAAEDDDRAIAGGVNTMGRMVGMAVAAQVSGAVVAAHVGPAGLEAGGYELGFLIAAATGVLSLVATVGIGCPAARRGVAGQRAASCAKRP